MNLFATDHLQIKFTTMAFSYQIHILLINEPSLQIIAFQSKEYN